MEDNLDIYKLEKLLGDFPQIPEELVHNFAPGVYARELHIPAGSVIIGKRHRHETMNMVIKGSIAIYMGEGKRAKVISAPAIFNSKPMVKKLGYALEDTVFVNVHPTTETDLTKIEEEFIIKEEDYQKLVESGELDGLAEIQDAYEDSDSGGEGRVLERLDP